MKSILAIELEILEPLKLTSAAELRELQPHQVEWLSIRLTTVQDSEQPEPVSFLGRNAEVGLAIYSLVAFAQQIQPDGTVVLAWYRGRSEQFVI